MPKYRKRPLEIEAIQIQPDNWSDIVAFLEAHGGKAPPGPEGAEELVEIGLTTAHGDVAFFRVGDWIVPEAEPGRFYPIKPDVFERTYDELGPYDEAHLISITDDRWVIQHPLSERLDGLATLTDCWINDTAEYLIGGANVATVGTWVIENDPVTRNVGLGERIM